MDIADAQDFLNLMVEVSVGVYVFFVSIPALVYSTYVPQELREIWQGQSSFFKIFKIDFSRPFVFVVVIVSLCILHFFLTQLIPVVEKVCDDLVCEKIDHPTNCVKNVFSTFCAGIASLSFVMLIRNVSAKSVTMKQGYLDQMVEEMKNSILTYYNGDSPTISFWTRRSSLKPANPEDLWKAMNKFGEFAKPGPAKQLWLKSMNEIAVGLVEQLNGNKQQKHLEGLKRTIKNIGSVMGDSSNLASTDDIKYAIGIYRELLDLLQERMNEEEEHLFTESYSAIARSLKGFAHNAILHKNPESLPIIVTTITKMPNPSSLLFEVANMALRQRNYDILAYAFNEIIGKGDDEQHNFWGIYAALYLKGGAFRQHAERMRINSGYPEPNKVAMQNAYDYHSANAHFDVADSLYHLVEEKFPKKPAKTPSPRKPRPKKAEA